MLAVLPLLIFFVVSRFLSGLLRQMVYVDNDMYLALLMKSIIQDFSVTACRDAMSFLRRNEQTVLAFTSLLLTKACMAGNPHSMVHVMLLLKLAPHARNADFYLSMLARNIHDLLVDIINVAEANCTFPFHLVHAFAHRLQCFEEDVGHYRRLLHLESQWGVRHPLTDSEYLFYEDLKKDVCTFEIRGLAEAATTHSIAVRIRQAIQSV